MNSRQETIQTALGQRFIYRVDAPRFDAVFDSCIA